MFFQNRYDAAMKLIPHLEKYKNENGVVLAVPRGGVPIGYYIAKNYNMPLELLFTKKIGHPLSEELAIGAVGLEDLVIDERYEVPRSYYENEIKKIRESLKVNYKKFMGDRNPVSLENKTVIIVDDGIATGNTLFAAIKMIRKKHPKKIVVAVPVAPTDTANRIKTEVDDFICLYTLDNFHGVGIYYNDFTQVTDDEVVKLLDEVNRFDEVA